MRIIPVILFLSALGAGIIALQIYLSKKASKWLGLILPIITFCISLIFVLNVANIGGLSTVITTIIFVFLLGNLSTAVLLAIYAACRGKRNKQRALDKMNIQDLE